MVERLDRLTVATAVDASKYTTGAQEKVAADRAMVQGAREVGTAITATDGKISTSGDVLARLSRQYVDGYAAQSRFSQGLGQLNRGIETGKISMEGAERILIGMNQRLGLTANSSELAAKGQITLASAVERVNAQIARQSANLAEAEASSRRLQAANTNSVSAGQRQAAGFNAGQQLQDIGMMAISGQSVGMLSLQQGPQLATAIQQGGGLAALGSGLASLFSLTTILTIGFTAATAATIQWFMKGREGAKSLDEVLKGHSDTLRLLKQQYGELGEASKSLGTVGGASYTDARARQEVATLQAAIRSQSGDMSKALLGGGFLRGGLFGSDTSGLDELLKTRNSPFQAVVDDLFKSIRAGNGGLEKFDENLNKVFDTLRSGSSNPAALNEELQRLSDAATSAFGVSGKFAPFQGEIDRLLLGLKEGNGDISTFATNVRRIGELNGIQKVADDAILSAKEVVGLAEKLREVQDILQRIDREDTRPGLRDLRTLPAYVNRRDAETRQLDEQAAADRQLARARTNAERMVAVEAQVRSRARQDGDTGGGLQARVDRALAEERNRQEVEARDAATQRSRSLASSLDQRRLELDLIGKTAAETERLRFQYERIQGLREESARTGSPIDPKEVANIQAAADAMGKYADALARASLSNELQFERDQLGRTSEDQAIASRLRSAGLPVELNGSLAEQMRQNQRFADGRELGSSFIRDFGSSVLNNGGKIGKAFGEALLNGLMNSAQKIWDRLADQAGIAIGNWLTGGSGLGGTALSGGAGGAFGTASGFADMLLGGGNKAANDNFSAPKFLSGIGSPVGATYSVANATSFIQQYASAIGIDPSIALKVARSEGLGAGIWQSNYVKNGFREPSFGPLQLLKGGPGTGFGKGLGNRFMEQTGLDPADPTNWRQSTAFALDQAKENGWGAWYGAKNQGITGFMGIDRSASKAVGALDKLTTSSVDTAQSLSGGLGKLGSSLSQFPAAPMVGGAGGGGGFLGNLLGGLGGGLSSAFSGTKAFSWLTKNPGSFIGLYADGTESAPPGWAWVGEKGPELMKMRGGETIRSNQRSAEMAANQNGRFNPTFVFQTDARGSTMSRAEYEQIAREQSYAALAQFNGDQVRGGFGKTQQKYGSYKG